MVQRTAVSGINRYGRSAQGVKTMNVRDGDVVSAVAMVVEDAEGSTAEAEVEGDELAATEALEATTSEALSEDAAIVEEEPGQEAGGEAEAADEEDE